MSLLRNLRSPLYSNLLKNCARYGPKSDGTAATRYGLSRGELEDPGDYYKYKYMFDDTPEIIGRYKAVKTCPYADRVLYEWDNYIFEYYGQWWDIGHARYHLYFVGMFFAIWIGFLMSQETAEENRRVRYGKNDITACCELDFIYVNYK